MLTRKKLAEQKAIGLHLLYPEVCAFPVNPIRVANRLGIQVLKDNSDGNIDGRYDADKNVIYLNTNQSLLRRRFTVCHELGHALLGHGSSPRDNSKTYTRSDYDPKEVEANTFAATLLMPPQAVQACVSGGYSIDRMCNYFGVSSVAMAIRLKQLGLVNG